MKRKNLIIAGAFCTAAFFGIAALLFLNERVSGNKPSVVIEEKSVETPEVQVSKPMKHTPVKSITVQPKPLKTEITESEIEPLPIDGETDDDSDDARIGKIKSQIYDISVEYIEDVDLLDSIVRESAEEPKALWDGDWVSIDDWKRYDDMLKIETDESGGYRLTPERDGVRSYSYDEEKKEFVWELDYYGKTITHKAKFISDDVLVTMKISGVKVALDIYQKVPQ